MAVITVPDALWDTSVAFTLVQPNQVVLQSPGGSLVLSRGTGVWHGELSVGVMQTGQEAQSVKAFIDALLGSHNEFFLPMRDLADLGSTVVHVTAATVVGAELVVTTNYTLQGRPADAPRFRAGNMIRMESQVFRVVEDQAVNRFSCVPGKLAGVGAGAQVVWDKPTMKVRLREPPPPVYSDPSFTGPFSLSVIETR